MRPRADGPRLLLPDHHREIEAACDALRTSVYADDPAELTTRFRSLEQAVLEHMLAEEEAILPVYAKYARADASAIRAAHEELRRQLFQLGIAVELHCVRGEALELLVETLRSHAAHEDREMYPWAQVHLPPRTMLELFARIAKSFRLLALDPQRPAAPKPQAMQE
ncbi:MAG TPA: hemerythrin domain-containing protein [Kofleriaceae bacterium]